MREVTYMDRGIDERLIIDGNDLGRVDKLSTRRLLEKLCENGILELNVINFDEYERNYKEEWDNIL